MHVRDTGIGIPPEMLSAVFDLFTQSDRALDRAQGGLGVGLTLVRRLVEMHGGTVTAHSEGPGKGSEFVVRLPVEHSEKPAPVPSPAQQLTESENKSKKLLLVDDNVDGAESLATLSRLAGHEVQVVHDGPAAVTAAHGFKPDVVVLDIGLPGMDGYEVARRLRADPATREAVLVAVTGYGREEDRRLAREAGFDHHFVKPVEFDALKPLFESAVPVSQSRNGSRMVDAAHSGTPK